MIAPIPIDQEIYILLKKYYCTTLNFYPKLPFADHKDLLLSTINPIRFHRTHIHFNQELMPQLI